jgi:hypothetical protein
MKLAPYGNQVGANYKLKEMLLQRLLHKYFIVHFLVHCSVSTHQIGSVPDLTANNAQRKRPGAYRGD